MEAFLYCPIMRDPTKNSQDSHFITIAVNTRQLLQNFDQVVLTSPGTNSTSCFMSLDRCKECLVRFRLEHDCGCPRVIFNFIWCKLSSHDHVTISKISFAEPSFGESTINFEESSFVTTLWQFVSTGPFTCNSQDFR